MTATLNDKAAATLVTYRKEGNIAVFELNDPPANTYTHEMMRQLDECIIKARFDNDVQVIILRGAGEKFFSAGANIYMLNTVDPVFKYYFCLHANETLSRLEQTPKLVIAALNGHCVGGGLEIAMAADIRLARQDAGKIGLPEVNLGVLPGTGGTQRLLRIVGKSKAIELMVTGRTFSFEEAQTMGIVNEVFPKDEFWESVMLYAKQFTLPGKAAMAVGHIKRAVQSGGEVPLEYGLAMERELQSLLFKSGDAKEGMAAYVEKRQPNFKGEVSVAVTAAAERFPTQLVIGGERVDAAGGRTFDVENPATEEIIAKVAEGDASDVDRAVASARATFESDGWRKMSARERGAAVTKLGELIAQHADELARLETLNNGKPLFESHIDVRLTADTFKYYGGWADKIHGETIPVDGNYLNYTLREPLGVIGAITPWNFPMSLAAWKLAPALACGNTIVLKPATQTPFTAIRMAELALEAGLPAGAFNCVPGQGKAAGMALVRHPDVDKIAFTGSTEVGKMVMREAASTVKKLSLELGGKSPNIVYADADLDAAARGALTGIFYGKGEVCAAGSRLLVEDTIREELTAKILERAKKMVAGDPLNPKTRLGAIVSRAQMESVLGYIKKGRDEGAQLLSGGERTPVNGKGYFVQPTIFGGVESRMTIAREEIFGPVLAMMQFSGGFEGATALANDTIYGLAAGIWTRDVGKALRTARAVRAGTVWVNTYNIYDAASPFGGYKQSGFGRELGMYAIDGYTQIKSVWVDLS